MGYFAIVIAAAAAVFLLIKAGKSPGRRAPLRKECLRELRLPRAEAEKTLERHISALRRKHPGKEEEWYLEKILYDLGRDRK